MWDRPQFLGQVPISAGAGFGAGSPWGFNGTPTGQYIANPQGTPLMTEQMNSPEHFEEEYHCYRSPAGAFVSIPFRQRESYLAAGYVAVDSSNCGTPRTTSLMGRRRSMGQATLIEEPGPFGFPTVPLVAPGSYAPAAPPGTTCAWEKDAGGNDVYVCRPSAVQAPPVAAYAPIGYPVTSLFRRF